jgi:toxin CptA
VSSTKSAPPLVLALRPSRILIALLALVHLGAVILLWLLPWPLAIRLAVISLLIANLLWVLRRLPGVRGPRNLQCAEWLGDGRWLLHGFGGESFEAELQADSFVHPVLVVLNFRLRGSRAGRSLVLFRDALERETLRRLRVRLGSEGVRPASG